MTAPEPMIVTYEAIAVVRSPFTSLEGMPLQSVAAQDVRGEIELLPKHQAALKDLDGFSHLWVVSHLHRSLPDLRCWVSYGLRGTHGRANLAVVVCAPLVMAMMLMLPVQVPAGTYGESGVRKAPCPSVVVRMTLTSLPTLSRSMTGARARKLRPMTARGAGAILT